MTVNLSSLAGAGQQFFDDNGVPLAGGKLYSYAAGTTTPQATYTSASGATPHSNPIVLNAGGRVATGEIWLTAGANYKFVLKTSSDVLLATWDNITGINGTGIASNAANVQYDPAGTGAVSLTVQAKLRQIVNVKDFGAVGDGVADDAAAIDNAVSAASDAGGGTVYIPEGTYLLGTLSAKTGSYQCFITPKDNVSIVGDGVGATTLKVKSGTNALYPSSNAPNVIATGKALPLQNCRFSDFTVDWNGVNNLLTSGMARRQNASIFSLNGGIDIVIERVNFTGTPGNQCIFFPATSNLNQRNIVIRDCIFTDNGRGLPGNYNNDHSSIYCDGTYLTIENNTFLSSTITTKELTDFLACYEIHGSYARALNNRSKNYSIGFWVTADAYKAHTDILVIGDSHEGISKCFGIASQSTQAINGISVKDCSFYQASTITDITTASYFVGGYTIVGCDKLVIDGCNFIGANYTQRFLQIQRTKEFSFTNNFVKAFGEYGIQSTLEYSGTLLMQTYKVQNNSFEDVVRPIQINNNIASVNSVIVENNNFYSSAVSAPLAPITVNLLSANNGIVSGNTYSPIYTTKYAGNMTAIGINVLDTDIGTYVPVVLGLTTAGTATYTVQKGVFSRRGNFVYFSVELTWTGHTGTGAMAVSLPKTALAIGVDTAMLSIEVQDIAYTAGKTPVAKVLETGTNKVAALYQMQPAGASAVISVSAAGTIVLSGTYTSVLG